MTVVQIWHMSMISRGICGRILEINVENTFFRCLQKYWSGKCINILFVEMLVCHEFGYYTRNLYLLEREHHESKSRASGSKSRIIDSGHR